MLRHDSLGQSFQKLWAAAAVSSLGDGVFLIALPLLAASIASRPTEVAAVTAAAYLPELAAPLIGVFVDRADRKTLLVRVDGARFAIVLALAIAVGLGAASIPLLVVAAFLLGSLEAMFEPAGEALLQTIVPDTEDTLERANGKLIATYMIGDRFVGRPLGGLLYAVAPWIAVLFNALSYLASAATLSRIRGDHRVGRSAESATSSVMRSYWFDVVEGWHWLWRSPAMRTMGLLVGGISLFNAGWAAILVLFAQQELGLGSFGFGLLGLGLAAGALLGTQVGPWLSRRLSTGTIIVFGILVQGLATGATGMTSDPLLAGAFLFFVGLAGAAWNVLSISLSQRLVPSGLFARVRSVYRLLVVGAVPVGAILGGLLADALNLRAPFLADAVAEVCLALSLGVALRRQLEG